MRALKRHWRGAAISLYFTPPVVDLTCNHYLYVDSFCLDVKVVWCFHSSWRLLNDVMTMMHISLRLDGTSPTFYVHLLGITEKWSRTCSESCHLQAYSRVSLCDQQNNKMQPYFHFGAHHQSFNGKCRTTATSKKNRLIARVFHYILQKYL